MKHDQAIQLLQKSDPILAEVITQVGAYKLEQERVTGDLLSGLVRSILYQQLSGKAAATIHQRFLQLYPDRNHPSAEDILNTADDILRGVGISRQKVSYLKDLSQKVLDGLPNLAELESMDDEAIIKTLISIKGVGRWTVQMLLIFRLHRENVLPTEDLGIRTAIKKLYNFEQLPNKKQMELLAQKWQPYCSIASWYLWRSLEFKN
jgi:DNA-3-methyladenine glycosylase II